MTPEALLEALRASEGPKGYFLHADAEHCMETAESLLDAQKRYGYLCCPCRLPSGDANKDTDIICPCVYRDDDVKDFGACYCTLFVSEEYKDDADFFPEIDERRPPEKGV